MSERRRLLLSFPSLMTCFPGHSLHKENLFPTREISCVRDLSKACCLQSSLWYQPKPPQSLGIKSKFKLNPRPIVTKPWSLANPIPSSFTSHNQAKYNHLQFPQICRHPLVLAVLLHGKLSSPGASSTCLSYLGIDSTSAGLPWGLLGPMSSHSLLNSSLS